jgi:hypothetical protein
MLFAPAHVKVGSISPVDVTRTIRFALTPLYPVKAHHNIYLPSDCDIIVRIAPAEFEIKLVSITLFIIGGFTTVTVTQFTPVFTHISWFPTSRGIVGCINHILFSTIAVPYTPHPLSVSVTVDPLLDPVPANTNIHVLYILPEKGVVIVAEPILGVITNALAPQV